MEYDIEEIILDLADLVHELRTLRTENKNLKKQVKEYGENINKEYEKTQENTANLLKSFFKEV